MAPSSAAVSTVFEQQSFQSSTAVYTFSLTQTLLQLLKSTSVRVLSSTSTGLMRWVHTCNVTVYRYTATLQVTDMIRSYDLNFHPMPNGVTVSCECYTVEFPVCYGSQSDVFAASSGFVPLYILRFNP
jgi:hypothetical protein